MSQAPQWEPVRPPDPPAPGQAPMTMGRIFEVGTRILRRHWGVLLLVSLLIVGPGALLTSATTLRLTEVFIDLFPGLSEGVIETEPAFTRAELDRAVEAMIPFLGATLLAGILGSIAALGFSATVVEDYHARPAHLGGVLRASLRRAPSALVFMLLTGLLILGLAVLGMLGMSVATLVLPVASGGGGGPGVFLALIIAVALAVAVIYLSMRWAPAYPAMVEEDAGWRDAIERSWQLSADNVLRIFAVSLVVAIATALISSLLGALFEAGLGAVAEPLGLDVMVTRAIGLSMATVVVAPVMAVMVAVLYFDLRARQAAPPAS